MKKSAKRQIRPLANPLTVAIKRASPVTPEVVQRLRMREWSAIEAFAQGQATSVDVALLEELLCMCLCSIELGIGPEAQATCNAAELVFAALRARSPANTPMVMNPAELDVMRDLQSFHDQQRAACNRREYSHMADMVAEAIALNLEGMNQEPQRTETSTA